MDLFQHHQTQHQLSEEQVLYPSKDQIPHAVDSCRDVTGELLTGPASARCGSLPPNVALQRPVVGHNLDLCYNEPTLKLPPEMSCPVTDVDLPLHGAAIRTLSGHISL
uniref:Uncharacterized protein n=1 Tax=Opuntia streptacantha TaxID=393608 RepID=A0A7C9EY93_OPUST